MNPKNSTHLKTVQRLRRCHTDIHNIIYVLDNEQITDVTKIKVANVISKLSTALAEMK